MSFTLLGKSCAIAALRDRQGATAVEFALLAPALFLLIMGSLEFGRLMWIQAALHYAVEEAARCASVTPSTCGTAAQITAYASTASTIDIAATAFTSATPSCGHQVSASYNFQFVASGLFTMTPTLTAQACFQ